MELSQIINTKSNPVNSSKSQMMYEEVQVHTELQGTGNGTLVDVNGKSAVILYVTGEFEAEIATNGSVNGTTFPSEVVPNAMKAYDFYDEKYVKTITKSGVYLIENIGYSKLRIRVNKYTSGAVTVLARVFVEPIEWGHKKEKTKKRLERVATIVGKTIAANKAETVADNIDTTDFVYFFAVTRSDTAHSREIYFVNTFSGNSLGSTYGEISVINDALQRQKSERIEPLSELLRVGIRNNDSIDHVYDVFVYGVR